MWNISKVYMTMSIYLQISDNRKRTGRSLPGFSYVPKIQWNKKAFQLFVVKGVPLRPNAKKVVMKNVARKKSWYAGQAS